MFSAMVGVVTPYAIKRQIRTVDPKFHAMIEAQGRESKDQRKLLDLVAQNQIKAVKFVEEVNQSAKITTTFTTVGQELSRYITSIDHTNITLKIPDGRAGTRIISLPHAMSDVEYTKFKLSYPKTVEE